MDKIEIDYDHHALSWETSKVSQNHYCRKHEINYGKFVAARSKLQASRGYTRGKPKFIEVKPKEKIDKPISRQAPSLSQTLSLKFSNGTVFDIPLNLSSEQYANVFGGLKAVL